MWLLNLISRKRFSKVIVDRSVSTFKFFQRVYNVQRKTKRRQGPNSAQPCENGVLLLPNNGAINGEIECKKHKNYCTMQILVN